jgi:hypothetical protein
MKTIKNITSIIICFLLISCEKNNDIPQSEFKYKELITAKLECMNMARPVDSYNYPVYPGMPEWAEFKTVEEMIAACQIPENILHRMSTQAVIQAIWEYPFLINVVHRYQYQMDFDATFLGNNAYIELTKRTDAGRALLERLIIVNPVLSEERFEPKALEILISQNEFLSQLNDKEKKKIIETTLKNDDLRQQNTEFTNLFRATAWLLIGKTLINADYAPFIEEININDLLNGFIYNTDCVYIEENFGNIPQLIVDFANEYIN